MIEKIRLLRSAQTFLERAPKPILVTAPDARNRSKRAVAGAVVLEIIPQ